VIERALVVAEARTWIGTPYQHQARIKGVAADCIGVPIGVARALALVAADFDITGYSRQPDPRLLMAKCREHMTEIAIDNIQIADVIVTSVAQEPAHFAIVADYLHGGLSMIHALIGRGVVEHRLELGNRRRVLAAFALPGVA
jgi:NlpC/P60 family putative phage cell wall peptidase